MNLSVFPLYLIPRATLDTGLQEFCPFQSKFNIVFDDQSKTRCFQCTFLPIKNIKVVQSWNRRTRCWRVSLWPFLYRLAICRPIRRPFFTRFSHEMHVTYLKWTKTPQKNWHMTSFLDWAIFRKIESYVCRKLHLKTKSACFSRNF